ncbi:MAG: ABC transporter ATP-binding protein/permease [Rhodobacteraceae bacterium]|nr:ABC transporter ATP-binding protein/permease [Paracoccaceae bacterium]
MWRDYLRARAPRLALGFLLMILEGATLAAMARLVQPAFDRMFAGRDMAAVWQIAALLFGLFLVRAATSLLSRAILTRVALETSTAMQTDLLSHLLTLDGRFYQSNPPGALIERVQGDTIAVQGVWATVITGLGRDLVSVVALAAVAFSIDPYWTLAAFVGIPLLIVPSRMIQRYVRAKVNQVRSQSGRRATRLDEVFHGIAAVKLNGIEDLQRERFRAVVDRIVNAEVKAEVSRGAMPALIDIIGGIGIVLVLVVGAHQIMEGGRTVGEFMAFFTAIGLTFQPLRRLGALAGTWQTAAASLARIYAILDTPPSIVSPPGAPMPDRTRTDIEFRDVRLSFGGLPALNGLSFRAAAGRTTAIVGPSGAGKSTVFNLLTRLIDADSGEVLLGGRPVGTLDLAGLRAMFSVVSQESALFDESIRENILLGRRDVPAGALEAALEAAHLTEVLAGLPGGLDAPAGPRGSALSGGQRQRVAIARALVRNAPVLLLDEATSALDAAAEAAVTDALQRLSAGRTTLVIAHRLATVRRADHILVLDRGRLVEEGTHDQLLARDGLYAGLCRLQFTD